MNKQGFLRALKRKLGKLKREERNKYVEYYDEIISDIVESGVSEAEAIERQGSVEQIAADILANTSPANLKVRDWRGICLISASAVLLLNCLVQLLFKIQGRMNFSAAVGIIGGADGPTSIFVSGKIGTPWWLYIVTAVVVVVTVIYLVKKRRKR